MARIAINGFGRIGRAFFKLALAKPELEIAAVNDLGDAENLAYLLRFDSAYGRYNQDVKITEETGKKWLVVGGHKTLFLQEKDPTKLPWEVLGVDVVVESTGAFESFEKARVHITAGAKRVVLTAPAKDDDGPDASTVLMGVNAGALKTCVLSSNGSCTTNSASPVLQILTEKLGIKKAFLNTVHGYTATQNLIDGPVKGTDYRRGRAAAANITPSSTGAAIAVARAVSELKGKFDGISMRVPVLTGSLSAISFVSKKKTTVEEINALKIARLTNFARIRLSTGGLRTPKPPPMPVGRAFLPSHTISWSPATSSATRTHPSPISRSRKSWTTTSAVSTPGTTTSSATPTLWFCMY